VRKALHTETGELVAIKILDKQRMIERGITELVKNEITIWKQMSHPNIIRLQEVLASDAQIFIVLEFAAGGELFNRVVAEGKLSESDARDYFLKLLEVLEYMHGLGVAHRDLKPENLLLSAAGELKLADFGFAILMDQGTLTERSRAVGSPNYLAPELLNQSAASAEYSLECSDVYGSGCILYVMCAGHLPFNDEGDALYQKIMGGVYRIPKTFSPNLQSLIAHIIEPDWTRRYTIKQIRSHAWCREAEQESPLVTPMRISSNLNMSFSQLETVKVIPKKKPSIVETSADGVPFINCFEYLADIGIFDLSRMVAKSKHVDKIYYAFSSVLPAQELLAQLQKLLHEQKKLTLESQASKYRIRAKTGTLLFVVQIYQITPKMHLVDFKKMRGSALEMQRYYKTIKEGADAVGIVYRTQ